MSRKLNILVVDNHSNLLKILVERLIENSHDVRTDTSINKSTLELSQTSGFDCVMSDLRMPSGAEVKILKDHSSLKIKIIVFVILGLAENPPDTLLKMGATQFFSKPGEIDKILHQFV